MALAVNLGGLQQHSPKQGQYGLINYPSAMYNTGPPGLIGAAQQRALAQPSPPPLSALYGAGGALGLVGGGSNGLGGIGPAVSIPEEARIHQLIVDLMDPALRETALLELSKKREQFDDLALVLWYSFGIMAVLLQEIVAVYPLLSPPSLTAHASNRVCNALALLQCVASHGETRQLFLNGAPFVRTRSTN